MTAGSGVTSNAIVVGIIRTEQIDVLIGNMAAEQGIDEAQVERDLVALHRPTQLLKRLATADEVANMVVYTASLRPQQPTARLSGSKAGVCHRSFKFALRLWPDRNEPGTRAGRHTKLQSNSYW